MSDMARWAIEFGPHEPTEMPCQRDGCEDGRIPAGAFAKHSTRECDECGGEGVIYIDPDQWEDTRDHDRDDTLLYDHIDLGKRYF